MAGLYFSDTTEFQSDDNTTKGKRSSTVKFLSSDSIFSDACRFAGRHKMLSDDKNFAVELLLTFVVLSSDRNSVVSEKYNPALKRCDHIH